MSHMHKNIVEINTKAYTLAAKTLRLCLTVSLSAIIGTGVRTMVRSKSDYVFGWTGFVDLSLQS